MPVEEARSEETPYGHYVTSDGWFTLNLAEALAVRNDEKGGVVYPIEPRDAPFHDFGVNVRVLQPGLPTASTTRRARRRASSSSRASAR